MSEHCTSHIRPLPPFSMPIAKSQMMSYLRAVGEVILAAFCSLQDRRTEGYAVVVDLIWTWFDAAELCCPPGNPGIYFPWLEILW